jgi:protein SCO1
MDHHSYRFHFLPPAALIRTNLVVALIFTGAIFFSSCQRSKAPTAKRYAFTGRVISIDTQDQSAVIDGDNIPGFMDAMAMSYKIKPPETLKQLSAGDSISAEVVVVENQNDSASDYWLENVKVTAHAKTSSPAGGSAEKGVGDAQHIPQPGDAVPDFSFTNQNGRRVSLRQYRGRVLLITFVYTRCPFPDFCPRISSRFAEIYQQLAADPSLARVRLLSLSFDPDHDTPKVLRDYGFSVAHTHEPGLFTRWEFAVPRAADLPRIADFLGLLYKPENGLIVHNLSTTVIGPDGRIVKWYHGGDWQVSDLMKDASAALAGKSQS